MALPLTPETGLFPDAYVEPFITAPGLADLAEDVIASYDEFEPIQTAIREDGLAITYVFETRPFDPLKEDWKPHIVAKVTKASPLWGHLAQTDLVIQFRQPFWDAFNERQRRAVVHHELTHIEVEPDGNGRLKLSLVPHDVEDFALTVRRFGPILPGRASFMKALLDWQHEQDTPEPTQLRPVETLRAGDGPTSITISSSGPGLEPLSVTIDAAAAKRILKNIDAIKGNGGRS